MRKRILSLLLVLCMAVSMLPTTAMSVLATATVPTQTDSTLTAGDFGEGFVKLTGDASVGTGLTVDSDWTIDLNGYTLTGTAAPYFTVNSGATLTIMDSGTGGSIKGIFADKAMIYVSGELILESGTLTGHNNDSAGEFGGAVRMHGKGSKFTMNGGAITGNTAYRGGAIATTEASWPNNVIITINGGSLAGNTSTYSGIGYSETIYTQCGATLNINGGIVGHGTAESTIGLWLRNTTINITGNPKVYGMNASAANCALAITGLNKGAYIEENGGAAAVTDDTVYVNGGVYCHVEDKYACGDGVYWGYENGKLTISGTGAMKNYTGPSDLPWSNVKASIKTVIIEDGVTAIGDWVFGDCSALTKVEIGDDVLTIGDSAFSNCTALTEITIPDSVKTIGDHAFLYCTALTKVEIGNNVTAIGDLVFVNCNAMTAITVLPENREYCVVDGVLFTKDMQHLITYPGGLTATAYTIPDNVITIEASAFYNAKKLQEVTIPAGVIDIGKSAFFGCKLECIHLAADNLNFTLMDDALYTADMKHLVAYEVGSGRSFLHIPEGVEDISSGDFYVGAEELTSLCIPDTVTGSVILRNLPSLRSVVIGAGVTGIGGYNLNLTDVYYVGDATDWEAVNKNIYVNGSNPFRSANVHYITRDQLRTLSIGECANGGLALSAHCAPMGAEVRVFHNAAEGYIISKVFVDGVELAANGDGDYIFTVSDSHVVTATFVPCGTIYLPQAEIENGSVTENGYEYVVYDKQGVAMEILTEQQAGGGFYYYIADENGFYHLSTTTDTGTRVEQTVEDLYRSKILTTDIDFYDVSDAVIVDVRSENEKENSEVGVIEGVNDLQSILAFGATVKLDALVDDGKETVSVIFISNVAMPEPEYSITVGDVLNGTVTLSSNVVDVGDVVTITATPDPGYELVCILVDGGTSSSMVSPYTVTITGNHIVTAIFEKVSVFTVDVTGNVAYTDGSNASGATVELIRDGVAEQTAQTDADGNYTFADVTIGNYNIRVTDTRYNTATSRINVVRMSSSKLFVGGATDLVLRQSWTVSGTVSEEADISLLNEYGHAVLTMHAQAGAFAMGGISNGNYVVRADGINGSVTQEITVFNGSVSGVELNIPVQSVTIKGTVFVEGRDGSITATAGAVVTLKSAAGVVVGATTTGADGGYAFVNLPLDTYLLLGQTQELRMDPNYGYERVYALNGSGYVTAAVVGEITAPDLILREVSEHSVDVSGKVTANGDTQDCEVVLQDANGNQLARLLLNNSGKYTFKSVADGQYTIIATTKSDGMGKTEIVITDGVICGSTDIQVEKPDKIKEREDTFKDRVPYCDDRDGARKYKDAIADEKRWYDGLSEKEKKQLSREYVERLEKLCGWLTRCEYVAPDGVSVEQGGLVVSGDEVSAEKGVQFNLTVEKTAAWQLNESGVQSSQDHLYHQVNDAARDREIKQYYEISMTRTVDGEEKAITSVTKDTDTTGAFRITLPIPEEYRGHKHYSVIHVHNGVPVTLADLDDDPDTITIEVDGFSTFVLTATDTELTEVEADEEEENTLYQVAVGETTNGTVAVDVSEGEEGALVTVSATPANGYKLKAICVDGVAITGNTFTITGDHVVTAQFEKLVQATLRGRFSLEVVNTIIVNGEEVDICRWVWTPCEG